MKDTGLYYLAAKRKLKKLDLSVTYKCGLRCQACGIWKLYRDDSSLAAAESGLEFYRKYFSKNNFWHWVSLTGGEPFLRSDLPEIAEIISANCKGLKALAIATSGAGAKDIPETVSRILRATNCRLHVSISLNGDKVTHNSMKGSDAAFDAAVNLFEKLKAFKEKRLSVKYEYLIAGANHGRLSGFFKDNPRFKINDFILSFEHSSFRYGANETVMPDYGNKELRKDVRYFSGGLRVNSFYDLHQKLFLHCVLNGIRVPCVAGRNTRHMDPYGKEFLCTLVQESPGSGKERACNGCYTPCESYFGLALGSRTELLKNICSSLLPRRSRG